MTNPLGAGNAKVPTPDRWRSIEPIIDAALELPLDERLAYVRAACAADASLLAEVEQLLAAHDSPSAVLDTPAAQRFALLLDDRSPALPEVLGGRYRIGPMLGRGGMATVYLADDLRHERQVAVKVLHAELAAALGAELFLAEIKTTAQLHHPHILPLHDSGDADGLLYYVTPYVQGGTLRRRLGEDQPLSVDEILRITTEVASALDAAHRRGVIHRDIKPENILLHEGTALVADFGIALAVSAAAAARMARPGLILGTPEYMSPEQATGDGAVDGRADVYSLGVVVYEMLTGRLPSGEPASSESSSTASPSKLPAPLDAVLARAQAPVPADRYASAGELAAELRQALASTTAGREADRAAKRPMWSRTTQALIAAAVLLAVGYAALVSRSRAETSRPVRSPDPRALAYFSEGTGWLDKRTPKDAAKAESSFKLAITADSTYADPHAGLAQVYMSYAMDNFGDYEPTQYFLEARSEAQRALVLDSTVAEAHAALANVRMFYDFDWPGAEREFKRFRELGSRAVNGTSFRCVFYELTGRFTDAVDTARVDVALQPRSEQAKIELGRAYLFNGQYDDAAELLQTSTERYPEGPRAHLLLGEVRAQQEREAEAVSEMQAAVLHSDNSSMARAFLANVYARFGRTADARRELAAIREKRRTVFVPSFDFAIVFAGLRNNDSTFAWLDRALDDHSMRAFLFDPTFDSIRSDPRYRQLLAKMHLPYHPAAR